MPISSVRGNLKGQRSYARNVVVLLTQNSFINTRKFVLHQETKPLIHSMKSLAVAENANAASSQYQWDNVLGNMDKDMYYDIIISDDTIQLIGKPTKHKEAKIKSRTAMRRLAKLLHATKGVDVCLFVGV